MKYNRYIPLDVSFDGMCSEHKDRVVELFRKYHKVVPRSYREICFATSDQVRHAEVQFNERYKKATILFSYYFFDHNDRVEKDFCHELMHLHLGPITSFVENFKMTDFQKIVFEDMLEDTVENLVSLHELELM